MKSISIYLIVTIFAIASISSCSSSKNKTSSPGTEPKESAIVENDTVRIANDSLEYEIIIIEPGFNAWLATQRPRGFYSQPFLEIRNRMYVVEYNQRVLQPQRYDPNLYIQQINYEPIIDYGYEVNYLLYNYFLFFEQRFNQRFNISRG